MFDSDDLNSPFIARDSASQKAQELRLIAAVREMEWGGTFGAGFCPACGSRKDGHGHANCCPIGLALAADHGAGELRGALQTALTDISTRRLSLESLIGSVRGELDELESCLMWVQDLVLRL